MKKVDVETRINKYLNVYPITMTDLLGRSYQFNSLEQYEYSLKSAKLVFNDSIIEFSDDINHYINEISDFINVCLKEKNEDNIDSYISSHLRRSLDLRDYGATSVNFLFAESFSSDSEQSEKTIKQVYSELGFEALKKYLILAKTPSKLSSYISSGEKTEQILASKYMLYITDHHSTSYYKRNTSAKTLYKEIEANVNETLDAITKEKDDYVNYMTDRKTEIKDWFEKSQTEYSEFMKRFEEEKDNLIATYEAKLKVTKPAEYMLEKADEYKEQLGKWVKAIIITSVVLLILLALILSPSIDFLDKVIEINFFNTNMPIYSSVIILAMISVILYALRVFVKMAISSKHLYEEYYQKHILTYFYLSLINDGKMIASTEESILLSLFSKSDTGLIKNDTNTDILELAKSAMLKNRQ